MIDLDREREHWRQRYHALPRARAMRSFARDVALKARGADQ